MVVITTFSNDLMSFLSLTGNLVEHLLIEYKKLKNHFWRSSCNRR